MAGGGRRQGTFPYITFWKLNIMKNYLFYPLNYRPGENSWPTPKSHP